MPCHSGKEENPMLRPPHIVLRTGQSGWNRAVLELLLGTQQWEFEFRYFDAAQIVPGPYCAFEVSISQCVQQVMACRIGVALNDSDAPRHEEIMNRGRIRVIDPSQGPLARPPRRTCSRQVR